MAMILITHDMGVIARTAERVLVMYAGRVAEEGPVKSVFKSAGHPYTAGLLESIPASRQRWRRPARDPRNGADAA